MKDFNLIVTAYQQRSIVQATVGLLVNPWRRWLPISPLFCFGCTTV